MKWVDDNEPAWRQIAYWLTVVAFFTLPGVVMTIHLWAILNRVDPKQSHLGEFQYLWTFHRVIAMMLAAELGLNSWDKRGRT